MVESALELLVGVTEDSVVVDAMRQTPKHLTIHGSVGLPSSAAVVCSLSRSQTVSPVSGPSRRSDTLAGGDVDVARLQGVEGLDGRLDWPNVHISECGTVTGASKGTPIPLA